MSGILRCLDSQGWGEVNDVSWSPTTHGRTEAVAKTRDTCIDPWFVVTTRKDCMLGESNRGRVCGDRQALRQGHTKPVNGVPRGSNINCHS